MLPLLKISCHCQWLLRVSRGVICDSDTGIIEVFTKQNTQAAVLTNPRLTSHSWPLLYPISHLSCLTDTSPSWHAISLTWPKLTSLSSHQSITSIPPPLKPVVKMSFLFHRSLAFQIINKSFCSFSYTLKIIFFLLACTAKCSLKLLVLILIHLFSSSITSYQPFPFSPF